MGHHHQLARVGSYRGRHPRLGNGPIHHQAPSVATLMPKRKQIRMDLGSPPAGRTVEVTCACESREPMLIDGLRSQFLYMAACGVCDTRRAKLLEPA
jgi:hypothetical protein